MINSHRVRHSRNDARVACGNVFRISESPLGKEITGSRSSARLADEEEQLTEGFELLREAQAILGPVATNDVEAVDRLGACRRSAGTRMIHIGIPQVQARRSAAGCI